MIYVVGGGGHAKAVVAMLQQVGLPPDGCFDDSPGKLGQAVLGVPVLGRIADFAAVRAARAVLGLGDNAARKAVVDRFPETDWLTVVSPHAVVHPSVPIGAGSVVFEFAVVQAGVTVGRHAILNVQAVVGHDASIGDFAHVAGGAVVAGEGVLEEGAFVGIQSGVCPRVRIGAWARLGAGSSAHRDVAPRTTAVGVPAAVRVKPG